MLQFNEAVKKKPVFEKLREKKIVLPPKITTREERSLKRQSNDIEHVFVNNAVRVNKKVLKKLNSWTE